jgi:putative colanic acid biosynthesis UDP-glucose lipid carrier transferase
MRAGPRESGRFLPLGAGEPYHPPHWPASTLTRFPLTPPSDPLAAGTESAVALSADAGGVAAPVPGRFSAAPQSVPVFVAALLEPVIAVACLLLVQFAHGEPFDRPVMLLSILVLVLVFPGTPRFLEPVFSSAVDIVLAWAAVLAILALCGYATDSLKFFEPQVLLVWIGVVPVTQFCAVLIGRGFMRNHAAQPELRRAALVVGGSELALQVGRALQQRSAVGVTFVGYIEDRLDQRSSPEVLNHIIGGIDDIGAVVQRLQVREVYITLQFNMTERVQELLAALQNTTASIFFVPDFKGVNLVQGRMLNMAGMPVFALLDSPFVGINALAKRVSDVLLASLILLLIAPLMGALAIGVKLSSPGPVIFRQRRNGLDGREIVVYKFRSMTTQDNGAHVPQARRGDPRITRFGAFMRRTSLDELPQFVNVLQGRMSVVGPRPHAVAHNEFYRPHIQRYMVRHKVRPGITGWAQVNGCRGETEVVEKMQQRVDYDIDYLRNWSLRMDLHIIARTVRLVLFDRGAY